MSANKECELPGADSCAVMEGEYEPDMDDEVLYTKPSLLGKLKAIASKVSVTVSFSSKFCISNVLEALAKINVFFISGQWTEV